MTQTQFQTLIRAVRDLEAKVDRVEARLQFEFPTEREAAQQIEAELEAILSPGSGVRVFADD